VVADIAEVSMAALNESKAEVKALRAKVAEQLSAQLKANAT